MLQCDLISREAMSVVGMSFAGPFPQSFPASAVDVQRRFWNRRLEVLHRAPGDILLSPYATSNECFVTYFAACQVDRIESVPDGMVGFTIPAHTYARVICTNRTIGEGYGQLERFMKENGHVSLRNACAIEVFHIREDGEEEQVEIWSPIDVAK